MCGTIKSTKNTFDCGENTGICHTVGIYVTWLRIRQLTQCKTRTRFIFVIFKLHLNVFWTYLYPQQPTDPLWLLKPPPDAGCCEQVVLHQVSSRSITRTRILRFKIKASKNFPGVRVLLTKNRNSRYQLLKYVKLFSAWTWRIIASFGGVNRKLMLWLKNTS